MVNEARLRAKASWPTWCYFNEYYNPKQYPDWIPFMGWPNSLLFKYILASTHGNEYPYMNGLFPINKFEFNSTDIKNSLDLVQLIVNFAKFGYFLFIYIQI